MLEAGFLVRGVEAGDGLVVVRDSTVIWRPALCVASVLAVVQLANPRNTVDFGHASAPAACLLGLALFSAAISLLWCYLYGFADLHGQQTSHAQLALLAGSLTLCGALWVEWTNLTRESGRLPSLVKKLPSLVSGNFFCAASPLLRRGLICAACAVALGGMLSGGSGLGGWQDTKAWALLLRYSWRIW